MNVNIKKCRTNSGNTGVRSCWNDIGIVRGFARIPYGKIYDASDLEALKMAIAADILADNVNQRFYPVQDIQVVTNASGTPTEQTFASTGLKVVTNDPPYDFTYQWVNGGFCLHHSLRKSKGQSGDFIFWDENGQIIAQSAGGDLIKGIRCYNYTNPFVWKVAPDASSAYATRLVFDAYQVNENIAIVDFKDNGGLGYLTSLNGLFNVRLQQGAARAAAVLTVKAFVGCDGEDMGDSFGTALNTAAAWVLRRTSTGNLITIANVAYNTGNRTWAITADTTDTDYTQVVNTKTGATAGELSLTLAGPTELAVVGINVVGFESPNALIQ